MVCLLPIEQKTVLTQITCENTHKKNNLNIFLNIWCISVNNDNVIKFGNIYFALSHRNGTVIVDKITNNNNTNASSGKPQTPKDN